MQAHDLPADLMIVCWINDGLYRVEHGGVELEPAFNTHDAALDFAKSIATDDEVIGFGDYAYVRGPRGAWRRVRQGVA